MNYYVYCDAIGIIRIKAARKPSIETRPKNGVWRVQEKTKTGWQMPLCPEITLGTLKTLEYLGSRKADV